MNDIQRMIDSLQNKFTMYSGLLYSLLTLLATAEVLALAGAISISALGLLASALVLAATCYAANQGFGRLFKIPTNHESWLITALILTFILPPSTSGSRLLLIGLTGILAMASKYVLILRGSPIFNPAAIGALIVSVTGILPVTWWVATPPLAPVVATIGLIVLYRNRKFSMFIAFVLIATALLIYSAVGLQGEPFMTALSNAWLSWPIIFLGSIMLTEPSTLPQTRYLQVLYGLLVGAIFTAQLHVGSISTTPQLALIAGNSFAFILTPAAGYLLKLKGAQQLAENIYEFSFYKPQNLSFIAGQYMEWTLPHKHIDSRGNRRTFSVSSSPADADIRVTLRVDAQRSSSFKTALVAAKPGQLMRASHVGGEFVRPEDTTQPLLLVAGGIGFTPFASMLRTIIAHKELVDVRVLYFASNQQSFAYKALLTEAQTWGVKTSYKVGRLSTAELQQLIPDIPKRVGYVSGPNLFVTNYARTLKRLGAKQVKTDHFSGY